MWKDGVGLSSYRSSITHRIRISLLWSLLTLLCPSAAGYLGCHPTRSPWFWELSYDGLLLMLIVSCMNCCSILLLYALSIFIYEIEINVAVVLVPYMSISLPL